MTEKAFNSLLATSMKFGGDASIAAGPVGAGAKQEVVTDLVSFSRAKGLYGGLNLDGTVVSLSGEWNAVFYGKPASAEDILVRRSVSSPKASRLLRAAASGPPR
jgi:lipid-binding SYLF domain-containing protein